MKWIFVPVAYRPECARALNAAFDVGQQLGANLIGCHIRPHSRSDVSLPADSGSLADYDAGWEAAWKGKKMKKSSAATMPLLHSALRYWAVKAKHVSARGVNDAKSLVKRHLDTQSDLLVMGTYSRSRLRQQIFGGVTEFLLHRANIPVLTLHA